MDKKKSRFLLFWLIATGPLLFIVSISTSPSPSLPLPAQTSSSQQLVNYFKNLFDYDWDLGEDYIYNPLEEMLQQSYDRYGSGYTPYDSEHIQQEMSITPIFSPDNSESLLISLIDNATTKLYIEQMYIYYEPEISDILQAIINAHSRGVEVKVIVGEGNSESGETAENLTSYGIPVRVSVQNAGNGNYFDTMHNKGVISDDCVLISSINWSPTSITQNREAGLIVESSLVTDYYEMIFDYDWVASEPFNDLDHFDAYFPSSSGGNSVLNQQDHTNEFATPTTFTGQFEVDVMVSPDNCFEILENALLNAQESIYISVYTLSSPYLLEALRNRVAAGLDVRLLLEQNQFSSYEKKYNRHTLYNLTEIGVGGNLALGRWAAAESEFTYQHSKYAIIDNETLIVSSGNWSRASCPKPQDDEDVDGNRDWWILLNGDGSEGNGEQTPSDWSDLLIRYVLPGVGVLILVGVGYLIIKLFT